MLLDFKTFLNVTQCQEGWLISQKTEFNIQQVSEKLERGQKLIEWGLIKINGKHFTRESSNVKGKKKEWKPENCRFRVINVKKSAKVIVVNKFYVSLQ